MVLWSSVLGALLVIIVGYLYLPGLLRRRRPWEPPLDMGSVPWLGHAMAFKKNMFEFLKAMQAKHGDIFTVQICGQYFTFIMDPLSFDPIINNKQRALDFIKYVQPVVKRTFGYQPTYENSLTILSVSTKYLMGDSLEDLNNVMLNNLSMILLRTKGCSLDASLWHEDGLFQFCYSTLFKAGYLSLFGYTKNKAQDLLQADMLFRKFRRFDLLFPRLVYSLLWPWEWLEIGQLQRLLPKSISAQHSTKDDISRWLSCMLQDLREQGVVPAIQDKFKFLLLWASQGNTGPTSFWALLFLLKHPEVMQAVRKEASQVLGEARLEYMQFFTFKSRALQCTPVLDSVMEETLRLVVAPLLGRKVQKDYILKMANRQEYLLRQGDYVALFPYLSVQMDPDIHPNPTTFKYDRFLNPDGSRKMDFYKKGKKVHQYSMPWGSGTFICPGRFFALSEMKLFILLMVTYFDLELVDPDTPVPPVDPDRWGFGTTQPKHDVRFHYRLKPME